MKTILIIILLSIAVLIIACTSNNQTTTEVIVLNDITDQFVSRPVAKDVLALYAFDQNSLNGGVFKFSDLTKVSFNETQEASIPDVDFYTSNQLIRMNDVTAFKKRVTDIITQAEQALGGEPNSAIYYPLATALNELSQSHADKKYALVFSDLMEHTPTVSFYSKSFLKMIKEQPDTVRNLLESQMKLESLSGITIYLLYEPINSLQDDEYKTVAGFYKDWFEDKGATVIITPNLQI